jgi:pyochelin biosynthesis protein PchG
VIRRPRVIVAGTGFGRVYLSAFRSPGCDFELAGILALGSERSRLCAERYAVPLYTDCAQIPSDIRIACVVVGGAVNGGQGTLLSETLMTRGIHVLQEHPLHHDEVARCLQLAQRNGVVHMINTHYVHIRPVRQFIAAVRDLVSRQPPLFIDAASAFQTLYTLIDIIGQAVGRLRPWALGDPSRLDDRVRHAGGSAVFRSLDGAIAGIPLTLRVQNQLQPNEPDNHTHFFHRITIGFEGGNLTLVNTNGPIVWCPRPHMPHGSASYLEDLPGTHLDFPTATTIGSAEAPSYRQILSSIWPDGIRHALEGVREAIDNRGIQQQSGQYYLTLSQIWQNLTSRLGPVELLDARAPAVLPADSLLAAAAAVDAPTRQSPI